MRAGILFFGGGRCEAHTVCACVRVRVINTCVRTRFVGREVGAYNRHFAV